MFRRRLVTVLAMALILLPSLANAQSGPSGAYRKRELGQIIREAGYDCVLVESIVPTPDPPLGWESLRPEIAFCTDGKKYLVAKSGRSGGNIRPVVRPLF
jgi:hypothetical protein